MYDTQLKLSQKKRKFIEYLRYGNAKKIPVSDIAEQLNISRMTYYRWLKDREILKCVKKEGDIEFLEPKRQDEVPF